MTAFQQKTVLPLYNLTPFTMQDFPDHLACIIWLAGCNMRCPYCHNPQIVKNTEGRLETENVMAFLKKRRGRLDGVVLSGGEASLWPGLPALIKNIKKLGYAVKLDTNGLRPDTIENFLNQNLLDYIALDYKAPPDKFKTVSGTDKYEKFSRTLDLLCAQKSIPLEIRTTVHTGLLNEDDIAVLIEDLEKRGYTGTYYIQNFRGDNDRPTLGHLPPQQKELDIAALPAPRHFCLAFRNFTRH